MRVFSEKDGLPQSLVEDLAVDGKGYLWAATQGGPALYDGHAWLPIQGPENRSIGWVHAMTFAADGQGWFATMLDGVWRWDGKGLAKDEAPGLPPALPRRILVAHGQVWLALNTGIYRRGPARWEPVPGLQWGTTQVSDFLVSGSKESPEWWVGTNEGLVHLREGQSTLYRRAQGLPSESVTALALEGDGVSARLWVGTLSGLCCLEGGRLRPASGQQTLPSLAIRRLMVSRSSEGPNVLWIGTEHGVARWQGDNRRQVTRSALGLPPMVVSALCLTNASDRQETLWIGSHAGLYQLPPSPLLTFPSLPGFADQNTWAILETRNPAAFWVGASGLGCWQGGHWKAFGPRDGMPDDTVYSLAATEGGRTLWIGTRGHGLLRMKGKRILPVPGFPDTQCYNLRASANPALPETVWASHRNGVSRWSRGAWRHFGEKDGLPKGFVTGLAEAIGPDGQSTLWACVRLKGVGCLRPGSDRWEWLGAEATHPGPTSLSVVHEPSGAFIWMGTLGRGILRIPCAGPLRTGGWVDAASLGGAPLEFTYAVAQDHLGAIYAYTSRGITRLQPRGEGGFHAINFTSEDGLPGDRCQHQIPLVDSSGRVWVATTRGIAVLDPTLVKMDQEPKPLLLQSITVGDRVVSPAQLQQGPLRVAWRDRRLDVRFTQISFHRGNETQYRTQLWDYENQPTPWTHHPGRELLSLPSGRFEMRIWAVDYAGNPSQPLCIPILVETPPWLRGWALALYVLVLGVAFRQGLRWRVRRLKSQNDLLSQRIGDATAVIEAKSNDLKRALRHMENLNEEKNRVLGVAAHDLRNPLSTIGLYAGLIEEAPVDPEVPVMAAKIRALTQDLGVFVGRILDSSRIESGALELDMVEVDPLPILVAVAETHSPRAQAKGLEIRLIPPEETKLVMADAFHLREILDNLVSNAIKFMPAGPPGIITLKTVGPWIHVEDQGPGFSEEDLAHAFGRFVRLSAKPTGGEGSTGLGLSIVKELVEAMGGEIHLSSVPGSGSCFRIHLREGHGPLR